MAILKQIESCKIFLQAKFAAQNDVSLCEI